jgi:hypothetical protein
VSIFRAAQEGGLRMRIGSGRREIGAQADRRIARRVAVSNTRARSQPGFNVESFLDSAGLPTKQLGFQKNEAIFSQGDTAGNLFYIQNGTYLLTLVSHASLHRRTNASHMSILAWRSDPAIFMFWRCCGRSPVSHGSTFWLTSGRRVRQIYAPPISGGERKFEEGVPNR